MNALRFITVYVTLGAYETEVLKEREFSHQGALQNYPNRGRTTNLGLFRKCNYIVQAQKILNKQPLSLGF